MQRAKAVHVFDQDLREAISGVKKDGYRKVLEEAHDQASLRVIEHEIRSDFQLTGDDRLQLLGEAEQASASFGLAKVGE
ncbi:MAG TPA: hypothetical protein VEC08_00380 [Nitrososphaerales archaeon]|nr:hypothetical protein [Nitrososphaerales archaeon]